MSDTREQKTWESRLRTRSSANKMLTTEYFEREHKVKNNESKNLKTDEAIQAKGHHIIINDEESKMKDNKLTNTRYLGIKCKLGTWKETTKNPFPDWGEKIH